MCRKVWNRKKVIFIFLNLLDLLVYKCWIFYLGLFGIYYNLNPNIWFSNTCNSISLPSWPERILLNLLLIAKVSRLKPLLMVLSLSCFQTTSSSNPTNLYCSSSHHLYFQHSTQYSKPFQTEHPLVLLPLLPSTMPETLLGQWNWIYRDQSS